jgi:hypothetical protein
MRGLIAYTSGKPERLGADRGRERWTILRHADGGRTLQAHTEIDDPPPVLRLVTVTVDAAFRPVDAFVRLGVGGETLGATWYAFGEARAECEGRTRGEGRLSQRFDLAAPLDGFGCHPVQNDAWVTAAYRTADGPGRRPLNLMMSSLDHRGATGPALLPLRIDVTYVGAERISVAAGDFEARHFTFGAENPAEDPMAHPLYHVWVGTDDNLFLRGEVGGYMQTRYELVELS